MLEFLSKEFKNINKKRTGGLIGFLLILTFFPVIFANLNNTQETRSHADFTANQTAATTSLSFYPPSSFSNPIQGSIGQPLSIDLMMAPGNNQVTTLKVHIVYPLTFRNTGNPATTFTINKNVFPNVVDGPRLSETNAGDIYFTVSSPTPIGYEAKVGTLTLIPQKTVNQSNQNDGVVGFLPETSAVATGVTGNAITQESQAYIFVSQGPAPTNVLPTPVGSNGSTPGAGGAPGGGSSPGAGGAPGGGSSPGAGGAPGGSGATSSGAQTTSSDAEPYSPQPSIWLFIIPIAITFFTILFY